MSVTTFTRVTVRNRWIRAAVATMLLASSATLFAQEEKRKEEEKKPAHKTNPPANKGNTPPRENNAARPTPAARPATPPANNVRPAAPPARPAPRAAGNRPVYRGANGAEVRYGANGRPQTVVAHGYRITHGPGPGAARAEFVRPDHSVIVTQGGHWGYVQRPYMYHNVAFVQRTYVVGGVSYAHVYRPWVFGGVSLNVYVSSRFYAPGFYGWAYTPWVRPVTFGFGWGGRPWFGFYAGYFTPYPVYAGPAYWLTDYIIAMQLQEAYDQQMAANAAAANYPPPAPMGGQVALSPDVKQAIADEVHRQLVQEQQESQSMAAPATGAPAFLSDGASHTFVVSNGLNVQSAAGECALTEGDVLQMTVPAMPNAAMVNLSVSASKGQDCRRGAMVSVAVPDLVDMQNHMRETLDQGLAELQSKQGQGGLPAEPPAAQGAGTQAPYAAAAPPPDPNIASEVSQQAASASQAEADVLAQASGPSAGGPPPSITLGMTIDQVVGLMGQPQAAADLGQKKIYTYGSMKVIFMDGKVSDVQ